MAPDGRYFLSFEDLAPFVDAGGPLASFVD